MPDSLIVVGSPPEGVKEEMESPSSIEPHSDYESLEQNSERKQPSASIAATINQQYKIRDANDMVIKTKSHSADNMIKSLNLPDRYTKTGIVDTSSFILEKIFFILPGEEVNTAAKSGFVELNHQNLQFFNFNVYSLQDIIHESNKKLDK